MLIIIVVTIIHTLSAGFLLVSANSCQIPSPENLWTKPGEHMQKPFPHTEYIYLFIYHVCMHLEKCVCEFSIQIVLQNEVAFMNIFKNQS